jgi:pimeloyl-ACP methyl ester carboxylesterase
MPAIADAVLARWLTPAADPAAAAYLRGLLLATASEGYAGAAEAIAAADLTETTRRLRLPALVLVGDQDDATPRTSAEALRDAIPGAHLEVVKSAAHIPTVEQPAAVTEALLAFLARSPSPLREVDHV